MGRNSKTLLGLIAPSGLALWLVCLALMVTAEAQQVFPARRFWEYTDRDHGTLEAKVRQIITMRDNWGDAWARRRLLSLLDADFRNPVLRFLVGCRFESEKEFRSARHHFRAAVARDGERCPVDLRPWVYLKIAKLSEELGDHKDAITNYERVIGFADPGAGFVGEAVRGLKRLGVTPSPPAITFLEMREDLDCLASTLSDYWVFARQPKLSAVIAELSRLKSTIGPETSYHEFGLLLHEAVAALGDGHARIEIPGFDPALVPGKAGCDRTARSWPFEIEFVQGECIIARVSELVATESSLRPGSRLIAVDGESIERLIARVSRYVPASTVRSRRYKAIKTRHHD